VPRMIVSPPGPADDNAGASCGTSMAPEVSVRNPFDVGVIA
jgi:hypothetical protein